MNEAEKCLAEWRQKLNVLGTGVVKSGPLNRAEISIPVKDLHLVRLGAKAQIHAAALDSKADGSIAYVGALLDEQTRTVKVLVTLANPDMAWHPGLFVNVEVISNEVDVKIEVVSEAIQSVADKQVVFVHIGDGFGCSRSLPDVSMAF